MMKKGLVLMLAFCLIIPAVFATSLDVQKTDVQSTIISELTNPAIFNLLVTNHDGSQSAQLYSFVGINIDPAYVNLTTGENNITVKILPRSEIRSNTRNYNFAYEIKGDLSGITKDSFTIRIIGLKDLLTIATDDVNVGDDSVNIMLRNVQDINLDNANLHFTSPLFDEQKTISLRPFESTNITLKINSEKIKTLSSGPYVFDTELSIENASATTESTLNYLPKELSSVSKQGSGFIIRKTIYTRTNDGNVPLNGKIEITKDVLSRLFTINSAEPIQVQRRALSVTYDWEKNLKPGETFSVTSTTNYTFPFILILLIVIVALLVKMYTRTNLIIDKRVSYVKTRGGEFALKVTLHVKAKKYVDNVQIIDRLPGMTQLYEKFGVMPNKIDHASRRLFWNVERLNAGEERVYSYIIYSKVRVVGRFELPSATATYLREGKTEQVFSNRTFFVAETTRTDI